MLRSFAFPFCVRLAGMLALAACGDTLVDDYRESWAVVQGRVLDEADRPVAGAAVRLSPVQPLRGDGDSTVTAPDGAYSVRVRAHGYSSYRADVKLSAIARSGSTADTLLTNVFVAESGRGLRPDTLSVTLRVNP